MITIVDLTEIELFIFDIDGTILLEDKLLPYAEETIQFLNRLNKKIYFLTNSSTRTNEEVAEHLNFLSIPAESSDIITPVSLISSYFRTYSEVPRVMAIAGDSVKSELAKAKIILTNNPDEITHVLVGLDKEFSYKKLNSAAEAVRKGAQLIGLNPDPFCPMKNGVIPDAGTLIKAIESASNTKAKNIIGKPSKLPADYIFSETGLAGEKCLMIGDRLDTDILFGSNAGMNTALVLTGVTSAEEAENTYITPHRIYEDLSQLMKELSLNTKSIT